MVIIGKTVKAFTLLFSILCLSIYLHVTRTTGKIVSSLFMTAIDLILLILVCHEKLHILSDEKIPQIYRIQKFKTADMVLLSLFMSDSVRYDFPRVAYS